MRASGGDGRNVWSAVGKVVAKGGAIVDEKFRVEARERVGVVLARPDEDDAQGAD